MKASWSQLTKSQNSTAKIQLKMWPVAKMRCSRAIMVTKHCWNNFIQREENMAGDCSFQDMHKGHTLVPGDRMRSHSLMHLHQPRKAARCTCMRFQADVLFYRAVWGGVTWTGYVGISGQCDGLPGVRRPSKQPRKGYSSEQPPLAPLRHCQRGCHTRWQGCRALSARVHHVCVFCMNRLWPQKQR